MIWAIILTAAGHRSASSDERPYRFLKTYACHAQHQRVGLCAKSQGNRESAADADCTFRSNRSAHHFYDVFGDSKPEPGTIDAAEGGILFPLKRFKDMIQKLPAG